MYPLEPEPARSRPSVVRAAILVGLAALLAPAHTSAQCRITGTAPAEDLELARAACARAAERFDLLYGVVPPGGEIELSAEVGYFEVVTYAPAWKIVWPSSQRMAETFASVPLGEQTPGQAIEEQWSAVLPHELGHLLLTAAAHHRRTSDREPHALPDWIHEGTAVWMEPPAYRSSEYDILRALQPFVPSLEAIVRMSISTPSQRGEAGSTVSRTFYPCATAEACDGRPHWSETFTVTTRHFPDGRIHTDTTFHDAPPPPPDPLTANFYAYSATLVRYLYDRGGSAAMLSALDRSLASGDETPSLDGLPALPRGTGALQADWAAWIRRWIFDR
ncbi:MAG: hypothetical protein WD766_10065 [Gemmatimonadota bacterium]